MCCPCLFLAGAWVQLLACAGLSPALAPHSAAFSLYITPPLAAPGNTPWGRRPFNIYIYIYIYTYIYIYVQITVKTKTTTHEVKANTKIEVKTYEHMSVYTHINIYPYYEFIKTMCANINYIYIYINTNVYT